MESRDRLGRMVGRNWWREYICDLLWCDETAWQSLRESGDPIHTSAIPGATYDTAYYQLTEAEYRRINPRPTLKAYLIANKGESSWLADSNTSLIRS